MKLVLSLSLVLSLMACGSPESSQPTSEAPTDESLIFRASFENGMDADVAGGDRRIYSANSYKELDQRSPGHWGEAIELAYDEGVGGGTALRFNEKNTKALFYTAAGNVGFDPAGWSGTLSFWLRLDPATDLEPGYCDPIQITDSAYNDSAVWLDFTKENPRQFRLGIFGELAEWNPENVGPEENPKFLDRLVVVDNLPFSREKWTNVAVVFEGLGGGSGRATLYLDGQAQGTTDGISEAFQWEEGQGEIRLGVNYVGLLDEIRVYGEPLSAERVAEIAETATGR